jgi:lipopolysaccharide/colanic/teichoic acid biosynthesis glycosyltransferase
MFDVYDFSRPVGTSVSTLEDWLALDTTRPTLYSRFCKRAFDLALSVVALIVLLPALIVIAGMVRVKLGPGVLYRQARVGRNGENFVMLKFRTMRHRSESQVDDGDERATHKTKDHPRLTEFGRVLRRLSLDELPQLFNFIRGQMSLVGPRPELSDKVDDYGLRSHPRHVVRPGLTGEWQVTHRASGIHLIHCFDDDMHYVRRINVWRDMQIIVRTFAVVLGAKGI